MPPARRTEILVAFEDPGEAVAQEVHGTVTEVGRESQEQAFHGWLQLLGILESVTGHNSGADGQPVDAPRRAGPITGA